MEIFKGMSIITISLLCHTDKARSEVKFKKSREMTIDEQMSTHCPCEEILREMI